MPTKISIVCYIHECTECLIQEFTVKELTTVCRVYDNNPTDVIRESQNLHPLREIY